MLIARLAPSKAATSSAGCGHKRGPGGRSGGDDDDGDDDDALDGEEVGDGARGAPSASASGGGPFGGKVLNARPCARCEAKMVQRGVRRCYFTLNAGTLGVLQYNADG